MQLLRWFLLHFLAHARLEIESSRSSDWRRRATTGGNFTATSGCINNSNCVVYALKPKLVDEGNSHDVSQWTFGCPWLPQIQIPHSDDGHLTLILYVCSFPCHGELDITLCSLTKYVLLSHDRSLPRSQTTTWLIDPYFAAPLPPIEHARGSLSSSMGTSIGGAEGITKL